MFTLWGKLWKNNHLLRDLTVTDDRDETRTHKVMQALERICYEFDLEQPIWLDSCIRDFQRHARTRFYQDSFIEEQDFDYLEILIIEEDE